MELQEEVNLMHFTRRASCDQVVVLGCSQLKSGDAGLKRSMSAPSLTKLSSAATGKDSQPAHSRIVECTAMTHSERKGRKNCEQKESWGVTRSCEEGGGTEGIAKVSID